MNRLRQVRKERGMTQVELSLKSGIPQQTISAIEAGERKNPGILTMYRIAQTLGCTVYELWECDSLPQTAEE